MTRTLTSNATTQSERAMGAEPMVVLKVDWAGSIGTRYYAGTEKTIGTIVTQPKLLEVGDLAWQLKQHESGSLSTFNIGLDDADGDLNEIIDGMAVENRSASLMLHFEGNDEADLLTLVKGKLVSPIEWSEGERTLSFVVESFITESEVGYAPTEEEFPTLPREVDGKAWPMCFGSPLMVPAVRAVRRATSALAFPFTARFSVNANGNLLLTGDNTLIVEDGSDFPQGSCAVNVGGIIVRGIFSGNTFVINSLDTGVHMPKYDTTYFAARVNDDPDYENAEVAWLREYVPAIGHFIALRPSSAALGGTSPKLYKIVKQHGLKIWFNEAPRNDAGNEVSLAYDAFPGTIAMVPLYGWPDMNNEELPEGSTWLRDPERGKIGLDWAFSAGTKVIVWEDYSSLFTYTYGDLWVCNLIPGSTIVAVYAEKNGILTSVPSNFYQKWSTVSFAPFNRSVTALYMPFTLSEIPEQGWGDQIYVVLASAVGSNVATIIKYILDNYSEFDTDTDSFDAVALQVANYPANFALLEKRSTLEVCEEIAWQARCALVYAGTSVKIKYLSEEPSSDASVDESNILQDSVKLTFTPAEEIVTRFVAEWRQNYWAQKPFTVSIENNIEAFGLREERFQFYIYNHRGLVYKSALFWSTRLGNSWQRAVLTTFLETSKLTPHDCLTLALDDETIFNTSSIKSIVHGQRWDLKRFVIEYDVWLPRVAGSSSQHANAWLSDVGDVAPAGTTWYESDPIMSVKAPPRAPKLAKILRPWEESDGEVPWDYLINVYQNGYDQPPTEENVPVRSMDENIELDVDQPVTTLPTGGMDYVQTSSSNGTVLATLGSAVGGGEYNWSKFAGAGPDEGTARELNLSTGISSGTKVVLHRGDDDDWWFFFPIATC